MFNNYALVQGADKFMPVDVYVPGCPPRPEALIYGIIKLQKKIRDRPGPRLARALQGGGHRGAEPAEGPLPDATGLELVAQRVRDSAGRRRRRRAPRTTASRRRSRSRRGRCATCSPT